jgi:predicted TIM-barrel fold metal-dependent hydrolase
METLLSKMANPTEIPPLREDPVPRPREFAIVSVDDHYMEPADLYEGRLPAKLVDRAPRIVEDERGAQWWEYDDALLSVNGTDAVQSWDGYPAYTGALRFDDVRRGAWDVHARLEDMDVAGIYASLCFPSMLIGFAGQRFMRMHDHEVGLACMRAYNDWILDGWCAVAPDRLIPSQITWLPDVEIAAAEIRRNAERGFKAVAFTENPEKLDLPSIHTDYWDPFLAACAETDTVVNLHIGSSSSTIEPSTDSPLAVLGAMFAVNGMAAALDWFYAGTTLRFPGLRIALSEAGCTWVPWVLDSLDHRGGPAGLRGTDVQEAFLRSFWFTSIEEPIGVEIMSRLMPGHVMIEADYPHSDSRWPDCQALCARILDGASDEFKLQATQLNACALYRHPTPPAGFLSA